jgi:hypothetical protein
MTNVITDSAWNTFYMLKITNLGKLRNSVIISGKFHVICNSRTDVWYIKKVKLTELKHKATKTYGTVQVNSQAFLTFTLDKK